MTPWISIFLAAAMALSGSISSWVWSPQMELERQLYEAQAFGEETQGKVSSLHLLGKEESGAYYQRIQGMRREQAAQAADSLWSSGHRQMVFLCEQDFGEGRTVQAGALVQCSIAGDSVTLEKVEKTWTRATGTGEYVFRQAYCVAQIGPHGQELTLQARGVCETAVPQEERQKKELSLGGVDSFWEEFTRTTFYQRKVMTWGQTFTTVLS